MKELDDFHPLAAPDHVIYDEFGKGVTNVLLDANTEEEKRGHRERVITDLFTRGTRAVTELRDWEGKLKRRQKDALLQEIRWCRERIEKLQEELA